MFKIMKRDAVVAWIGDARVIAVTMKAIIVDGAAK